jgi:ribosomal protein S18 acetylase RimI-like enzyme
MSDERISPVSPAVSPAILLRPMRATDFAEVSQIAYQTGFFGDSAQTFFADRALFGDLWLEPYVRRTGLARGAVGFVATRAQNHPEHPEHPEILGYIVGMTDQNSYQIALSREVLRVLIKLLHGQYPQWRGGVRYLARAGCYLGPHLDHRRFAAHLHVNLLPAARGLGLGGKLLDLYLATLRTAGVAGVQLSTTLENKAAVALYQKRGFAVMAQQNSKLWQPWLGREVTRVAMGLVLNSS